MKTSFLGASHALRYLPGDSLLETDRLAALSLRPLGGDAAQPSKGDDLPALRDVLTFLKFTPEEINHLMGGVQSTVKIVAGIVSVVGAVTSVVDLMNTLGVFGPQDDATQVALEKIGERVDQIYHYLINKERRGLHVQAGNWRSACALARNAVRNARISPTTAIINDLVARRGNLDDALNAMLNPHNAYIAFVRDVYKYTDVQVMSHWIDAAVPPFMTRTDGVPINYAAFKQELQTEIWDAGHFIDVLFSSLEARMLVTVTIEPAFRSTGYDREQLKRLVTGLTVFIDAWRGAMLVANPAAGLSGKVPTLSGPATPPPGTGVLQNPYRSFANYFPSQSAPAGIALGAVDPVTGITAWESFWDGFEIVGTVTLGPIEAWGGGYDITRAKDPPKALAAAMQRQAQLLDQVVSASGIGALVQLRAQLQLAASEVIGSEFVQLPNARFRLVKAGINLDGSPVFALRRGGVESVDLGRLTAFAQDPGKKYKGTRYFQETEKTFRFRMARRTSESRIQLGYRLRIGDTDIRLVEFSRGGFNDQNVTPFPTETIAVEVREAAFVYNVRQSHVFSFAEEDLFEAGEPIPVAPWSIPGWSGRLFLDERLGKIALAVEVRFKYDPTGQDYTGEAIVTIRNLDPEQFPDGVILPVQVFETHIDGDDQPKEYLADSMTVHLVPSFLVMRPDYFAAYWDAWAVMLKTMTQLDDPFSRLGLQELMPRRPFPDPAWAVRRQVLETNAVIDVIDAIRINQPEAVAEVIQQFKSPTIALSTAVPVAVRDSGAKVASPRREREPPPPPRRGE